jgi:multicomponent K+:H+ antiporter subunit E
VAVIVLGLVRDRRICSGFVDIPLELRDPHGLAVLAMIVTATPGTVWAGLSPDGATLTLHMLDIRDEQEWIRWFKDRYERRLMEIFE